MHFSYLCTENQAPMTQRIIAFLKNWTLPIAMIIGAASYFIYRSIPALDDTHAAVNRAIAFVQPALIFTMLFLTFCKIQPRDLRLSPWQGWALLLQCGTFALGALLLLLAPKGHWTVIVEGFIICMICPTATAAAVVTRKLGGNVGTLTAYTIIINLAAAILVPILVPLIHPNAELTFLSSFLRIIGRVFPLLFGPFLLATIFRHLLPKVTERLSQYHDLAFYLWAVALALAIAVTTKSIVHADCPWTYQLGIASASALACIIQFAVGRHVGRKHHDMISAAQACGQKNIIFAIWMCYTFMTPVTSIAGGFYSVWHNIYNSYQLYKKGKKD